MSEENKEAPLVDETLEDVAGGRGPRFGGQTVTLPNVANVSFQSGNNHLQATFNPLGATSVDFHSESSSGKKK